MAGRRKDGTVLWVDIKTRLMRDASGKGVGFIGAGRDVTARRAAEEALRESELKYRLAYLSAEKEKRTAEILSRVGLAFASELDRDKLVQRVTDEATELTGAAFGAFFHNLVNEKGESYLLYTLSGVPREAFAGSPCRATRASSVRPSRARGRCGWTTSPSLRTTATTRRTTGCRRATCR